MFKTSLVMICQYFYTNDNYAKTFMKSILSLLFWCTLLPAELVFSNKCGLDFYETDNFEATVPRNSCCALAHALFKLELMRKLHAR